MGRERILSPLRMIGEGEGGSCVKAEKLLAQVEPTAGRCGEWGPGGGTEGGLQLGGTFFPEPQFDLQKYLSAFFR